MSRIEELTAKEIDDAITRQERAELDALIAGDPAARREHLLLLDVERLLLAEAPAPDLRAAVLDGIERAREGRMLRAVMPRIVPRPAAAPTQPSRRRRVALAAMAVTAAAAAVLIGFARRPRPAPEMAGARAGAHARFVASAVDGVAGLHRRGAESSLRSGTALEPGDQIDVSAGARARLVRADATAVEIDAEARLSIELSRADLVVDSDALALERGRVVATVGPGAAGRALSIRTPHARATALGTRFSLMVGAHETRLDVSEGRVVFQQLRDGSTREVSAGQNALAIGAEATAGAGEAAAGGRSPGSREPAVVLAFDFENGELDPDFNQGHLVRGSACPGGGTCVAGTLRASAPLLRAWMVALSVEHEGGLLFSYNNRQVLSFDYWVGPEAKSLYVQLWNRDQKQNYAIYLREFVRERWGHALVRLADLRPNKFRDRTLENGDALSSVVVLAGRPGGRPLYLDNIRIEEWPDRP